MVKLDMLVNDEPMDAFSCIVHRSKAVTPGCFLGRFLPKLGGAFQAPPFFCQSPVGPFPCPTRGTGGSACGQCRTQTGQRRHQRGDRTLHVIK